LGLLRALMHLQLICAACQVFLRDPYGGMSTGPRTPEGLERSRRANWKHGHYSREAKAERSRVRAAIVVLRYLRAASGIS
jgi:hypothetical protein